MTHIIKLLEPLMPRAANLLPYLASMDSSHIYTNNGPLVQQLEARVSGITGAHCAAVANATLGLELALRASYLSEGSSVIVPAYTFTASGLAVQRSGQTLLLGDVDPKSWLLTPELAYKALGLAKRRDVQAVMPVATHGTPVDMASWDRFAHETGLEVVIDAAAAFPGQRFMPKHTFGAIPVVFSLHATKFVGAGEGGLVCSVDLEFVQTVRKMASFWSGAGTNAKMSEYHAAVALASMEAAFMNAKCVDMLRLRSWYDKHAPRNVRLRFFPTVLCAELLSCSAHEAIRLFSSFGVEAKRWYEPFLNKQGATLSVPPPAPHLPTTDYIFNNVIGLPYHAFLRESDVVRVCHLLGSLS